MKALLCPLAACLLAAACAASAAPPATAPQPATAAIPMPAPPVPEFKHADANHDGKISRKEAQRLGVPKKTFTNNDFDRNGTLNQTEWMFVRLSMTDFAPPAASAN